jgi:hypothetical protein
VIRSCAAVAALALVLAGAAAGDGDPASDVLLLQNTFLPSPAPSSDAGATLERAVAAVYAKGFRIKVAVIASPADLGAIPSLFGKPTEYAKFLGTEIATFYVGPLLIAMPAGFGIWDGGRTTAAEEAVLPRGPLSGGADDLTRGAAAAVAALLQAGALRSKDILAPYAVPGQTSAPRTGRLRLSFRLYDDSGRAGATLTLSTPAGRGVGRIRVPLRRVSFQAIVSVTWRVPPGLARGPVRFCLVPVDPSGNRGKRACEPLLVT